MATIVPDDAAAALPMAERRSFLAQQLEESIAFREARAHDAPRGTDARIDRAAAPVPMVVVSEAASESCPPARVSFEHDVSQAGAWRSLDSGETLAELGDAEAQLGAESWLGDRSTSGRISYYNRSASGRYSYGSPVVKPLMDWAPAAAGLRKPAELEAEVAALGAEPWLRDQSASGHISYRAPSCEPSPLVKLPVDWTPSDASDGAREAAATSEAGAGGRWERDPEPIDGARNANEPRRM